VNDADTAVAFWTMPTIERSLLVQGAIAQVLAQDFSRSKDGMSNGRRNSEGQFVPSRHRSPGVKRVSNRDAARGRHQDHDNWFAAYGAVTRAEAFCMNRGSCWRCPCRSFGEDCP
jgi:hypothetical protein